uniref:Coiled-coil domain-containing protein 132 n=1 Tax=Acrobeloides nanus TaxID=290746 RepID=A0A914ED59_9BILA
MLPSTSALEISESSMPATEQAAAEVFDEIDFTYFIEGNFDATAYELQKMLGDEFELDEIERERFKLKRQLQVVSKKVTALITKNSAAFAKQVQQYAIVQEEAGKMVELISGIREGLSKSQSECRTALSIVANDRKRKMLRQLKSTLFKLKTLYETEFRLKELIQEGDFPGAIQLCVEAKNAARVYENYSCIKDLTANLCRTLESMESHIDDALAGLTVVFDINRYSLVYSAYLMLDKVESAAVKLSSFFRATIESSARTVLVDHLTRSSQNLTTDTMSYEQLCEAIKTEEVLTVVRELGMVLCKVLFIYHAILRYHIDEDERLLCAAPEPENEFEAAPIVEKGVMQKSLSEGLYGIFKTASNKFNILLCCQDLSQLKFDNFLDIVEMSNRFRKFGRHHFGNSCGEVAISLEKQTYLYFGRYHQERMEELKMFLENEVFTLCPVPLQFTLFDLQEFQFLKESTDAFDDDDLHVQHVSDQAGLGEQLDYTILTTDAENPFLPGSKLANGPDREGTPVQNGVQKDENKDSKGSLSRSSSEDSCYINEDPSMHSSMPNICNTALNLLRFFGRYIRMTSMLHSIAEQAIFSITQLFHYFTYSIFTFFSSDTIKDLFESDVGSDRLQRVVETIRKNLIMPDSPSKIPENAGSRFYSCHLSPCVNINEQESLYALAERIVAVESVIFLGKQLELLKPVLESLLPTNFKGQGLQTFYKNILVITGDLRDCIYVSVNWDISDIQSQHNKYVDVLIQDLKNFHQRLKIVPESVHMSTEVNNCIWNLIILFVFKSLVQGYADSSKKCTNEGRALMLLDFQQLIGEMESMAGLRPLPHKSYVEEYIKAYYLPESNLETWMVQHQEYTNNQLVALLNATSSFSKKAKSRLINVLEGKDLSIS